MTFDNRNELTAECKMSRQRSKTKSETHGGDQVFMLVSPEDSSVWGEIKTKYNNDKFSQDEMALYINSIIEVSYEVFWSILLHNVSLRSIYITRGNISGSNLSQSESSMLLWEPGSSPDWMGTKFR